MKYKALAAGIFFYACSAIEAQNISETRNFIRSFSVGKESSLEVNNKYGNVHVIPWKRDSASIRAEVKAFAQNRSRLEKMLDGVSINFNDSKYSIKAETEFSESIGMILESFKGMTGKIIPYDSRIEINYYIKVPEYLNLTIINRFGDIKMENALGDFSVSISNGSFTAGSLGKGASLKMSFCDATIERMSSASIDADFSELSIGEAGDLDIKGISSKFDIKKAQKVRLESRKDRFFIGDAVSLSGNSYFSDFRIGSLKSDLKIDSRYGNLDAENIERGFESVDLTSSYTDISLGFEKPASYNLDIRHVNAFVVIPDEGADIDRKRINEEKKEYMITGKVGRGKPDSMVKIDATRGNVYLK